MPGWTWSSEHTTYITCRPSSPQEMGERVIEVLEAPARWSDLPAIRAYRHKAFVNITFGCDNFSTLHRAACAAGSAPARRDILSEIRQLVADGCREYPAGAERDAYSKGRPHFPTGRGLRHAATGISEIDGLHRIRFTTSHPRLRRDDRGHRQ